MRKLTMTIVLCALATLIASTAFADDQYWIGKWRHEYPVATGNVILSGLRETDPAARNRAMLRMFELESMMARTSSSRDEFYSDYSATQDPALFPTSLLFGIIEKQGIDMDPKHHFIGRTFRMED